VVSANEKVNRALKAGAYAVGAEVEINEIPGYLPLQQEATMGTYLLKHPGAYWQGEHSRGR